ncbi:hypothetical protein [Phaeovulum vinaykumarii]|uniref:Uncharacterized protein n=1 Tax=Phaeovulum vinaykumarii TaxID=407234 RepID=A0A1N7N218_9RHOB|nr:hypothetical protein [Phaeovulum vinaykumarii]SIS92390.1 hypothetical protein SAMN05421795_1147 [Phaeovulum vinaykumarii]SOC18667.1 hypothetical protein SAMN05878426_11523 [Phaeovulum vinaykumarii]
MPDAIQLYRDFLAGKPGTCIFTGEEGCHAFVTEDEIDATFGSRHDTRHFVWLDRKPGEIGPEGLGFVSDDYIDTLLAGHRIAFTFSDRAGPPGDNREGVKAAFLLGADRMRRVLALPVDANKCVSADAIAALPLGLRGHLETRTLPALVPLARLVERMIPLGATIEDGEARGRLVVLSRIATGMSLDGLDDEAERFAIWAADHAAREDQANEITRQMLDQIPDDLTQRKGKLQ